MPPCNVCQNPTLCTERCHAYAEQLKACEASGQMEVEEIRKHREHGEMPNVYDDDWVCEAHPDKPFLHDGCPGPGMPSDAFCAKLEEVSAHVEAGEMPKHPDCAQECQQGVDYGVWPERSCSPRCVWLLRSATPLPTHPQQEKP